MKGCMRGGMFTIYVHNWTIFLTLLFFPNSRRSLSSNPWLDWTASVSDWFQINLLKIVFVYLMFNFCQVSHTFALWIFWLLFMCMWRYFSSTLLILWCPFFLQILAICISQNLRSDIITKRLKSGSWFDDELKNKRDIENINHDSMCVRCYFFEHLLQANGSQERQVFTGIRAIQF